MTGNPWPCSTQKKRKLFPKHLQFLSNLRQLAKDHRWVTSFPHFQIRRKTNFNWLYHLVKKNMKITSTYSKKQQKTCFRRSTHSRHSPLGHHLSQLLAFFESNAPPSIWCTSATASACVTLDQSLAGRSGPKAAAEAPQEKSGGMNINEVKRNNNNQCLQLDRYICIYIYITLTYIYLYNIHIIYIYIHVYTCLHIHSKMIDIIQI